MRYEIARRVADMDDPVRYAVFSDLGGFGRWRWWLDVTQEVYGTSVEQATLFKRERVARAVAKACSEGRRRGLLVPKITTRSEGRRVLRDARSHSMSAVARK